MNLNALAHSWRSPGLSRRVTLWALLVLAGTCVQDLPIRAHALPQDEDRGNILTIDHQVPHKSTVPANAGESVNLFVRERFADNKTPGKAVLMVHGRSVPALAGFDLQYKRYGWAMELAKAGFDVFVADLQGNGRSPISEHGTRDFAPMQDPCNVSNFSPDFQQGRLLISNPLSAECPPSYPFRLVPSNSEWDELDTVVEYIRNLPQRMELPEAEKKVALVSWSRGSLVAGPYAVQHPEKVDSLFLLAPIFNPIAVPGIPYPDGFAPPVKPRADGTVAAACTRDEVIATPPLCPGVKPGVKLQLAATAANPTMTLTPRNDVVDAQGNTIIVGLMDRWNRPVNSEIQCEDQIEDGIQDVVWNAVMDNDELGRTWGPPPPGAPEGSAPEGVMRVRSFFPWGWTPSAAYRVSVPALIIFGEFDTEGTKEGFRVADNSPLLYDTIPHDHKLLFKVACAGHYMPWERQSKVLHHISKEWLKHGAVEGFTNGKFFIDREGNLFLQ